MTVINFPNRDAAARKIAESITSYMKNTTEAVDDIAGEDELIDNGDYVAYLTIAALSGLWAGKFGVEGLMELFSEIIVKNTTLKED